MRFGERGEVVNTSGCEPDIREFDSHRSPHFPNLTPICDKKFGVFSLFIYTKVVSVNVLQVAKTRTIEHPSYFSKFQGIKAYIYFSMDLYLNLVKSISANSTRLYLFTLAVC